MNKILKILSILVIGFVMFSCSTPTNDPIPYVPESSGPETLEEPTYSITFTPKESKYNFFTEYLNTLDEFNNLKKGTTVPLCKKLYCNDKCDKATKDYKSEDSKYEYECCYYYNTSTEIDSVVIENESVEVELSYYNCSSIE